MSEEKLKVTKENINDMIDLEINNNILPKLKEEKVFPLILIGKNFDKSEDNKLVLTLMSSPNLDTVQKRISVLEDVLNAQREILKTLN